MPGMPVRLCCASVGAFSPTRTACCSQRSFCIRFRLLYYQCETCRLLCFLALISLPLLNYVSCNPVGTFPAHPFRPHAGPGPQEDLQDSGIYISKHNWNPNLAVLLHAWKCSPDRFLQSIKQYQLLYVLLQLDVQSPLLITSCFLVCDLWQDGAEDMLLKDGLYAAAAAAAAAANMGITPFQLVTWLGMLQPTSSAHAVAIAHCPCAAFQGFVSDLDLNIAFNQSTFQYGVEMENQAVREPRPLSCDPLGTGLLCSLVRPLSVPVSSSFQFDPFLVFVPGPLLSACREVVVCLLRSHDCVCSRTCFYHGQLAEHLVNLATVPVCPSSSHEGC